MKKYVCIGGEYTGYTNIEPRWLAKWYGVSYIDCWFCSDMSKYNEIARFQGEGGLYDKLIQLTYRPNGDYAEHLAILKAEHLIYGDNG